MGYQGMGNISIWWRGRKDGLGKSLTLKRPMIEKAIDAEPLKDTYPWPYRESDFADWPEENMPGEYTLVSDPVGFVVKHPTSFCAWKIRELTGRWPQKRQPGVTYHAKNWQEFLALNGYTRVLTALTENLYGWNVGILPEVGEFGDLLWYEYAMTKWDAKGENGRLAGKVTGFVCTTYRQGKFCEVNLSLEEARQIIWVKIR